MWTDVCPSDREIEQYIDGQLSEQHVPVIEQHLASCKACEQRYEELGRSPAVFTQKLRMLVSEGSEVVEPLKPLPQIFGAYRLLRRIGEGGMGTVYLAEHLRLRTLVAIKVLKSRLLTDGVSRDRFCREIEAAGQVDHPAIVRARDAGEVDGSYFLAMDFVDGINLSSLIKQVRQVPFVVACEIACRVAKGLSAIHLSGMVHRDIKPGNLILSKSGDVQILDLGLALHSREGSSEASILTETGQLMGTVDYIAPEQANDTHRVDHRADIYALGASLFSLLSGHPPYGRSNAHLLEKLSKLANEPPIALNSVIQDLPPALIVAVEKSLAKLPDDRFNSASEFIDAVQPYGSSTALADYVQQNVHFPTLLEAEQRSRCSGSSVEDTVALPEPDHKFSPETIHRVLSSPRNDAKEASRNERGGQLLRLNRQVVAGIVFIAMLFVAVISFLNRGRDMGVRSPVVSQSIPFELATLAADPSQQSDLWKIFSRTHRPDERSAVLHHSSSVLPTDAIVQRYVSETDSAIKAGLLLAIPNDPASLQVYRSNDQFMKQLRSDFLNLSDPELHSAIERMLQTNVANKELADLNAVASQRTDRSGWYQPLLAPCMMVIPRPQSVELGSPPEEFGRMTNTDLAEDLRTETIDYSFAISSKEITQRLFAQLTTAFWQNSKSEPNDLPQNAITWDEAARFCNLLSVAEGILPEEFCYEETLVGSQCVMKARPDALRRRGFRLPTEAEWEIACRAGTRESRPFGNQVVWLNEFVHGGQPHTRLQSVALLKPNPLGLFDMLGNVSEWTNDFIELPDKKTGHVIRGGSAASPVAMLRSAGRYYYLDGVKSQKVGFRVAQTVALDATPVSPSSHENPLLLSVGPPWSTESGNTPPSDSEFHAVTSDQTISLGHWTTSDLPQRWFRLTNISKLPVQLDGVPPLIEGFQYMTRPATEIAPGASTSFCIRSLPAGRTGTHNCHVPMTLAGQSVAEALKLHLISRFHGPLLEVMHVGGFAETSAEVSVGNLPPGSELGIRLYLRNVGDEPAQAKIAELIGDLKLASDVSGVILPHRLDQSFRVIVKAGHSGEIRGTVKLRSPQDAVKEFQIHVSATVLPDRKNSAIGVFRDGVWLVDWNHDGQPEERIPFGKADDQPFTGDFDGDGIHDLGIWRRIDPETTDVFLLRRGKHPFPEGFVSHTQIRVPQLQRVVAMDRNADGRSELGYVYSYNVGQSLMWMVDISNQLHFEKHFQLGRHGDIPFVADWTGDRVDDFAVSTPGTGVAAGRLRIEYFWSGLSAQKEAVALSPFDVPLAGDWDGDGDEEIAGWRPPIENQPAIWQFDIDGDFESDRDLEGFGAEGDVPFVLHPDRQTQPQ